MCTHCENTGSLSKDLDGYLDCTHCEVASTRALIEAKAAKWAKTFSLDAMLWLAFQQGKEAAEVVA